MQKVYLQYNFGYIEHVRNITVVMPSNIPNMAFTYNHLSFFKVN